MNLDPMWIQGLAALLFAIGMACALARRNVFFLLMGVELMLNAVCLSFVGFGRTFVDPALRAHLAPIFVIAVAAAEACVGLAMVICITRGRDTLDADAYAEMKE